MSAPAQQTTALRGQPVTPRPAGSRDPHVLHRRETLDRGDRLTFLARGVELREVVERATITVLDELVFAQRDPDGRFVQTGERTPALQDGESGHGTTTR